MALVKCTECGTEISDKAASCIKCGAPVAAVAVAGSKGAVVTTQQTAKRYKGMQFGGAIAMGLGLVVAMAHEPGWGAALMVAGFVSYVIGRFSAWWNHG